MSVRPWPVLSEDDRWLTEAMERRLDEGGRSAEQLRVRACELRVEAEQSDQRGTRDAVLALAERYEQAAIARLSA